MANLIAAAAFMTAVQALAFDGKPPEPTNAFDISPTSPQPEITAAPDIRQLAKRAEGHTVLVGPDNTCGYFDGRPGAVYSCNGALATCALVTTSAIGAVACCIDDECGLRIDCIDYRSFYSLSACNNACVRDTFTVKCTNSRTPYCGTVTFFSGIKDYYCDTLSNSILQQLYTTWHGESDGRTFTPVVVTLSDDSFTALTTTTPGSDDDDDSTSTVPDSSSPTSAGSEESSGSSGSSHSSSSSVDVGAIVGGVVGGIAGLALIGLCIFFLIRHFNKKKTQDDAAAAPPPMESAGYQPPYNPHYSQQYAQAPPAYPPQAGFFAPDQNKPDGVVIAQLPDATDPASPVSSATDHRQSVLSASTMHSQQQQPATTTTYQPQQYSPNVPPTVHEASGNVVGARDYNADHHGQLHELG
ncbi:hypothetical protein F4779DRAFT_378986 [Xylariaceae sp. FL0662B]|nr:hypothetical protein F4779DRAFT_378986 [Xylariaceae sp. FL0662B]